MSTGKEKTHVSIAAARRDLEAVAVAMKLNPWIREEARKRGWRLIDLYATDYVLPAGISPRGAIVSELPDAERLVMFRERGCKVVRLGYMPHPKDHDMPAVLEDVQAQGSLAARHFFERGITNVCFFGSDPWSNSEWFFEGFRAEAEELGMACHLYQFSLRPEESVTDRQMRRQGEFVSWLKHLTSYGDDAAGNKGDWMVPADFATEGK